MGWQHISSHPVPDGLGEYSDPFLIEYRRAGGATFVAVSRSYRTVLGDYVGLASIQHGVTFDSADNALAEIYEPLSWQPMPAGGMAH